MKKIKALLVILLVLVSQFCVLLNFPYDPTVFATSSTVGTSTNAYATGWGYKRDSFWANTLFWAFYSDGTNIVYYTSPDNVTWTVGPQSPINACNDGRLFSVFYDGTHVHIAWIASDAANIPVYYYMGTPNSNGSISSTNGRVTAIAAAATVEYYMPCICADTSGYPWIVARKYVGSVQSASGVKSSTTDGTWTTDFTFDMSTTNVGWAVSVIPLTGGKVLGVYAVAATTVRVRCWNGTGWNAEVASTSKCSNYYFSAANQGGDASIVFLNATTYNILHVKYTYATNSMGTEATVQSGVSSTSSPALTINTANNDLYCFWAGTTAQHVYYSKYNGTAWATATDWITEIALTGNDRLTSFYSIAGTTGNNYVGLEYMNKTASAYQIRFSFLTVSTAGDTTKPTYSSPSTNTTMRDAPCNFSVTLADETALANYTFGCNNTGTWVNETLVTLTGGPTSYKANTTKTLTNTVGVLVQWEYWFADTSNNLNNTGLQNLTVTSNLIQYVTQQSTVDSQADIGTHSNFASQQAGPDSTCDNMSEVNVGSSEAYVYCNNYQDPSTLWSDEAQAYNNNTADYAQSSNIAASTWGGYLVLNFSSTVIGTLLRYYVRQSTAKRLTTMTIELANQTGLWTNVYSATPLYDADYHNVSFTSKQYTAMRYRFYHGGPSGTAYARVYETQGINDSTINYRLDLEEQWTNADNVSAYRNLCIYTGSFASPAETINVQWWNASSSSWITIMSSLAANAWNNVSVIAYLTTTTFTIRFVDGSQIADGVASWWQKDCAFLNTWTSYPISSLPYPSYSTNVAGVNCTFTCLWLETSLNLSGYIFSTNNTGSWSNGTGWTSTWSNWPTNQSAWANVTQTLNSTAGLVIGYQWFANNTANNWNLTYVQTLTLGTSPPAYYMPSPSYNSTIFGGNCLVSCQWAVSGGNLSGYIFSTNNTGSWANSTWTNSFSTPWTNSTSAWANVTIILNGTIATGTVSYCWYCNSSTNTWVVSVLSTIGTFESCTSGDSSVSPLIGSNGNVFGQTFTVSGISCNVTSVAVKLYAASGADGTVTVEIRATNSTGMPIGTALTYGTIEASTITTASAGDWYMITVTNYALMTGTRYAVVISDLSDDQGVYWRRTGTDGYSGGCWQIKGTGDTWTNDTNKDGMFIIYGYAYPSVTMNVPASSYHRLGQSIGTGQNALAYNGNHSVIYYAYQNSSTSPWYYYIAAYDINLSTWYVQNTGIPTDPNGHYSPCFALTYDYHLMILWAYYSYLNYTISTYSVVTESNTSKIISSWGAIQTVSGSGSGEAEPDVLSFADCIVCFVRDTYTQHQMMFTYNSSGWFLQDWATAVSIGPYMCNIFWSYNYYNSTTILASGSAIDGGTGYPENIYFTYSPDKGQSWYTSIGALLSLPINPTLAKVIDTATGEYRHLVVGVVGDEKGNVTILCCRWTEVYSQFNDVYNATICQSNMTLGAPSTSWTLYNALDATTGEWITGPSSSSYSLSNDVYYGNRPAFWTSRSAIENYYIRIPNSANAFLKTVSFSDHQYGLLRARAITPNFNLPTPSFEWIMQDQYTCLGNRTEGSLNQTVGNSEIWGCRFTATENATLSGGSVYMWMNWTSANYAMRLALYDSNLNLIAYTDPPQEMSSGVYPGYPVWCLESSLPQVSIVAGTDYYICFRHENMSGGQAPVLKYSDTTSFVNQTFKVSNYPWSSAYPATLTPDTYYNESLGMVLYPAVFFSRGFGVTTFTSVGTNTTMTSQMCQFQAFVETGNGLSYAQFRWNVTASDWDNSTYTPLSGTATWALFNFSLPDEPCLINWEIWANDTNGNWGSTGTQSLTVTLAVINSYTSIAHTFIFSTSKAEGLLKQIALPFSFSVLESRVWDLARFNSIANVFQLSSSHSLSKSVLSGITSGFSFVSSKLASLLGHSAMPASIALSHSQGSWVSLKPSNIAESFLLSSTHALAGSVGKSIMGTFSFGSGTTSIFTRRNSLALAYGLSSSKTWSFTSFRSITLAVAISKVTGFAEYIQTSLAPNIGFGSYRSVTILHPSVITEMSSLGTLKALSFTRSNTINLGFLFSSQSELLKLLAFKGAISEAFTLASTKTWSFSVVGSVPTFFSLNGLYSRAAQTFTIASSIVQTMTLGSSKIITFLRQGSISFAPALNSLHSNFMDIISTIPQAFTFDSSRLIGFLKQSGIGLSLNLGGSVSIPGLPTFLGIFSSITATFNMPWTQYGLIIPRASNAGLIFGFFGVVLAALAFALAVHADNRPEYPSNR
jgi:hypothetical protein